MNAPPEVSIVLTPEMPTVLSTIEAEVSVVDPDGKSVLVDQSWSVNDTVLGEGEKLSGVFERGDRVRLDVSATDGFHTTDASAEVVVANALPTLSEVRILPESPRRADELSCVFESDEDPDGDAVSPRWSWSRDGEVLSTDPSISGMLLDRGDTVACSVWLSDGVAETSLGGRSGHREHRSELEVALVRGCHQRDA